MSQASSSKSRAAWQKLYSRHGLQYGGPADIAPLESLLSSGMVVLDLGCGDGKTTERLAKKCEVVACDFSRDALRSFIAQRGLIQKVNLVECNMRYLPFERERFDAVVMAYSISHMPRTDRQNVAHDVSRIVRGRGLVYVEAFSVDDIRMGHGQQVESATFMRGNGIMTHYFQKGEIPSLFDDFLTLSETELVRRASLGAISGERHILRVMLQKRGA
jgi:cyclopropane fatty-acyl-phospholipid synthase-like methyltransferase